MGSSDDTKHCFYGNKEITIIEKGMNTSIVKSSNGERFEAANRKFKTKPETEAKNPCYYLLHNAPVFISDRTGKFMVTVKSDRFHGEKKVFTSDLQTDLTGMH